MGCNGLPYVLAQRLRDTHPDLQNLIILPGPGHIEINMCQALFKLLWPVGLEEVAKLHGYKTTQALDYAKKASEHRKSWQMLQVLYEAATHIIVMAYTSRTSASDLLPTVGGLISMGQHD